MDFLSKMMGGIGEQMYEEDGYGCFVPRPSKTQLKNFICRFPDLSFMLVSASSRLDVEKRINEVTDPGKVKIVEVNYPICLDFDSKDRLFEQGLPLIDPNLLPKFDFEDLIEDKKFSNVQLLCENDVIHCHASVLTRFEHFKELLKDVSKTPTVISSLKKEKKKHVLPLIRFMYHPRMALFRLIAPPNGKGKLSAEDYLQIMMLAKRIKLPTFFNHLLRQFWDQFLRHTSLTSPHLARASRQKQKEYERNFYKTEFPQNVSKVLKYYEISRKHGCDDLSSIIAFRLLKHCHTSRRKLALLPSSMKAALDMYRQSGDPLFFASDDIILRSVGKGGQFHPKDRLEKLPTHAGASEFPYQLSGCGEWNERTFRVFRKLLFPHVFAVEERMFRDDGAVRGASSSLRTAWRKEVKEHEKFIARHEKKLKKRFGKNTLHMMDQYTLSSPTLMSERMGMAPDVSRDGLNVFRTAGMYEGKEELKGKDLERMGKKCGWCQKWASKKCTACKMVVYCGQKCQRKAWKDHKVMCKEWRRGTNTFEGVE